MEIDYIAHQLTEQAQDADTNDYKVCAVCGVEAPIDYLFRAENNQWVCERCYEGRN